MGPLPAPRNPTAGANRPTVTSDSGRASTATSANDAPARRTSPRPVIRDRSPRSRWTRSACSTRQLVPPPVTVARPVIVPPIAKLSLSARTSPTWSGAATTRSARADSVFCRAPSSPVAIARLRPDRGSSNVMSPSTSIAYVLRSSARRPVITPCRGSSSGGTSCASRRVPRWRNRSAVSWKTTLSPAVTNVTSRLPSMCVAPTSTLAFRIA